MKLMSSDQAQELGHAVAIVVHDYPEDENIKVMEKRVDQLVREHAKLRRILKEITSG